ncbi:DUF554 domain-containing protein [Actinotalea sp.]|uniref:DUF554 domain-containing protein n=1 Tax=Actinotalea sp. TaxID=1872145 RepID=UPI002D0CC424|nr:DUF554 domain-containing protein [Actinotalea sp.]HQY33983.1 DUF554 domain-containing protein [Actinotalea sp.]HRA50680.1 DUF554 domain-containing protein [Actinotalea sp.]
MDATFPGLGTLINMTTIVVGSLAGIAVGNRLREHTRSVVTDSLGLVTLLVAALSAASVTDPSLAAAVPSGAPVLIVLASLLLGGVTGSLLRLEQRLAGLGGRVHDWTSRRWSGADVAGRERFIEGWLAASLLFCVGPLAVLGSLSDGLGNGIEQLLLKSVLDGFAALAFASTFGTGVLLSALSVGVVQGALTVLGMVVGSFLPDAHIAALTATGGLMLVGIALRLLRIREDLPVAAMLPALVVAPVLTQLVVLAF